MSFMRNSHERSMKSLIIFFSIFLSAGWFVEAQDIPNDNATRQSILLEKRKEKSRHLTTYRVTDAEARIRKYEKIKFPTNIFIKGWNGFRPLIGGMPSGSGFVVGGGYIYGLGDQYFQWQVNGRYSTKGYKIADFQLLYPTPQEKRRFELKGSAEYRDLTSLSFFGIGNESSKADQSNYLLKDRNAYAHLWINPRGLLSFGAQGGWYAAETGVGDSGRSFDAVEVPGFGVSRTNYAVAGGWVEFDIRDKWAEPPVGIEARFTAMRYDQLDNNQFDFTRYIADIKGYIPLGYRSRILAVRLRTSHSDRDQESSVPFYLMETLGGAKTLRGFDEYRFRDRRNLLIQAEYRWEVWAYIDMTVFVDTGKVFSELRNFDFEDLHTGYGLGLRLHTPSNWRLRFDLARSSEGFKFHVGTGPSF
jgi:hypothetical protein